MNLIEFNNICLSLGWVKDLGYSIWDEYHPSSVFYNENDAKDNLLITVDVDVNYIAKPGEPIEEFTIYITDIVDGKITVLDERKYDLLYKDWSLLYIKELIKTVSDYFKYIWIGPNLKNKDIDELLKKFNFIKPCDWDEVETWYITNIVPHSPVILYTAGQLKNYNLPEGIRVVKVLDTVKYDIYNVYSNNPEIGHYGTNYWKCTWKDCKTIEEMETAILAAKEKLEQYNIKDMIYVGR